VAEIKKRKTVMMGRIVYGDRCIDFISVNEDKTKCPQFYFSNVKRGVEVQG
jgi:hypothetical protein